MELLLAWFVPAVILYAATAFAVRTVRQRNRASPVALVAGALATIGWLIFGSILTPFYLVPTVLWGLSAVACSAGVIVMAVRWRSLVSDRPATGREQLSLGFTVLLTGFMLAIRLL